MAFFRVGTAKRGRIYLVKNGVAQFGLTNNYTAVTVTNNEGGECHFKESQTNTASGHFVITLPIANFNKLVIKGMRCPELRENNVVGVAPTTVTVNRQETQLTFATRGNTTSTDFEFSLGTLTTDFYVYVMVNTSGSTKGIYIKEMYVEK